MSWCMHHHILAFIIVNVCCSMCRKQWELSEFFLWFFNEGYNTQTIYYLTSSLALLCRFAKTKMRLRFGLWVLRLLLLVLNEESQGMIPSLKDQMPPAPLAREKVHLWHPHLEALTVCTRFVTEFFMVKQTATGMAAPDCRICDSLLGFFSPCCT